MAMEELHALKLARTPGKLGSLVKVIVVRISNFVLDTESLFSLVITLTNLGCMLKIYYLLRMFDRMYDLLYKITKYHEL